MRRPIGTDSEEKKKKPETKTTRKMIATMVQEQTTETIVKKMTRTGKTVVAVP